MADNRFGLLGRSLRVAAVVAALGLTTALGAQDAPKPAQAGLNSVEREVLPDEPHEEKRVRAVPALIEAQGRLHFRYARELLAAGRLGQALEQLDRFLLIYPKHEWRFFGLVDRASALERLGRIAEAVPAYRAAYRQAHNLERGALAYLRAGRLLAELGRHAEARDVFLEITRTRPASRSARLAEIELRALRFLDARQAGPDSERRSKEPAPTSPDSSSESPAPAPTGTPEGQEPEKTAPVEPGNDPGAGKKTPV